MKQAVIDSFAKNFGGAPQVVVRAPGRLEILGNHTDYNLGTVLSVAVDRFIFTAASPAGGNICTVWDDDFAEKKQFPIDGFGPHTAGDWAGYVKGMVVALGKRGVKVPAFNAAIKGNVPLSAGMSSSAAMEMSVGLALCKLAGVDIGWLELAKAGQDCENNYIGANTGLLDQFSSLRGAEASLIYSDFRSYETEQIAMPKGYSFVVVNSMVKHVLTNEYNDRRNACQQAVAAIAKQHAEVAALRDVPMTMLDACKGSMDAMAYDCAKHVVGEIERVAAGKDCLARGDIAGFGALMFQSHDSSRYNFRNSCEELDDIVDLAHENKLCLGARLSGGGFGGISVHLVKTSDAERYASEIGTAYEKKSGKKPQVLVCTPADGAMVI